MVNAGHPPPTVFHADGTYDELPVEPSSPIGLDVGARSAILVLVGWRLGDRAVPPVIRAVTR